MWRDLQGVTTDIGELDTNIEGSGVNKPTSFQEHAIYELDPEIELAVSWDKDAEEITFRTIMPTDSYLAIIFGTERHKSDMIVWEAREDKSSVVDGTLNIERSSYKDRRDDLVWTVEDFGSRHRKIFETKRALDTGDSFDFAIPLDREIDLSYKFSTETSYFTSEKGFSKPTTLMLTSDG